MKPSWQEILEFANGYTVGSDMLANVNGKIVSLGRVKLGKLTLSEHGDQVVVDMRAAARLEAPKSEAPTQVEPASKVVSKHQHHGGRNKHDRAMKAAHSDDETET